MRYTLSLIFACLAMVVLPLYGEEASAGFDVLKVNHEFINAEGYTQEEPGDLVKRARYQSHIQKSSNVQGVRFFIHWKAPANESRNLVVKLEARGYDSGGERDNMEVITHRIEDSDSSGWIKLDIDKDRFKHFGKLMAWKVSLWSENQLKTARHSFTWDESYSKDQVSNQHTNP